MDKLGNNVSGITLNFDNSFVGIIDDYILSHTFNEHGDITSIVVKTEDDNEIILNLIKYKCDFPLLLNEIKGVYKLPRINYNIVIYKNVKYLAYLYSNDITLNEYKNISDKRYYQKDIRRLIAFQWLMNGLHYDIKVCSLFYSPLLSIDRYRIVSFYTCKEKDYVYQGSRGSSNSFKNDIPKNILKEWFDNSLELFYSEIGELMTNINIDDFKKIVTKIINKYSDKYYYWLNDTYLKLQNHKYCQGNNIYDSSDSTDSESILEYLKTTICVDV